MTELQAAASRKTGWSRRVLIKSYDAIICHKHHSDGTLQFMQSQSQVVGPKVTLKTSTE